MRAWNGRGGRTMADSVDYTRSHGFDICFDMAARLYRSVVREVARAVNTMASLGAM